MPSMPERIWPALFACVLLFVATGGWLSQAPTHAIAQPYAAAVQDDQRHAADYNNPSLFVEIGHWAYVNRDTIAALCAIGALFVGSIVAVATGLLWVATRKLSTSTAELSRAAHEQSAEMKTASNLTQAQLFLSRQQHSLAEKQFDLAEKHFLLADRQNNVADKQHGLQRLQYLAEHGPRIKIRSIGLDASGSGGLMFQAGFPVRGHFVIFNEGAADATILKSEYRFFMSAKGLPMVPPLWREGETSPIFLEHPFVMSGHGSHSARFESRALEAHEPNDFRVNGPTRLYIMGAILYSDGDLINGQPKERWMGFCRIYDAPTALSEGSFVPVENPDYEYSD